MGEVINTLDDISPEFLFPAGKTVAVFSLYDTLTHFESKMTKRILRNHFNGSKTFLNMEQKRRFLHEYQLTKYLTKKMKKKLSRELNASQATVKVSYQKRIALEYIHLFLNERNSADRTYYFMCAYYLLGYPCGKTDLCILFPFLIELVSQP